MEAAESSCEAGPGAPAPLGLTLAGSLGSSVEALDGAHGSDSGVEVGAVGVGVGAGAGLGAGAAGVGAADGTPASASCDSSLLSCCYSASGDDEDALAARTTALLLLAADADDADEDGDGDGGAGDGGAGDGAGDAGSESSSVAGGHLAPRAPSRRPSGSSLKKKQQQQQQEAAARAARVATVAAAATAARAAARPRSAAGAGAGAAPWGAGPGCRRGERASPAAAAAPTPRGRPRAPAPAAAAAGAAPARGRSASARAATTPSGGGRGPRAPPALSTSLVGAAALSAPDARALDKYATLPRRRRHRSPGAESGRASALAGTPVSGLGLGLGVGALRRSHSASRDPSLNRAASLRKQHHLGRGALGLGLGLGPAEGAAKSLPPYPRRRAVLRARIYHEICVQTALTGRDVAHALALARPLAAPPAQEAEAAAEAPSEAELQRRLDALSASHARLQADCERQRRQLQGLEQRLGSEAAEKLALQRRLSCTQRRVRAMLGRDPRSPRAAPAEDNDSLQELELHLQTSGRVVIKQQREINDLQTLCHTLQRDLDKSLAAQKTLLQQQQEIEAESMELQEFLQAEKSTLADALKDAEAELSSHKQLLVQRELELQQQQEECKHLVRISEQRRQENLALQARLCGLEKRSKELLLQQGAAVSGAAVALSGLSSRLDGLVEQLVTAYNISEKDLEDVIFHNEAYSKSNSSVEASPERTPVKQGPECCSLSQQHSSPKRGASFVTAVIAAIRNAAAQSPFSSASNRQIRLTSTPSPQEAYPDTSSGSGELLDSEKDPCNVIDNDDDTISDSHNSSGNIPDCHVASSKSLQNLSQAILVRQQSEMAQNNSITDDSSATPTACAFESCEEGSSPLGDYCSAATLVDQIIDVDNLVTRLLKVLRIIQLENETCIDELHDERIQLAQGVRQEQENRREVQEKLTNWEQLGSRLRSELEEARLQLQLKVQELDDTKADLQCYKEQVENLSQDMCNLSSMCQRAELQLQLREAEAEKALQQWQDKGELPSPDILARIVSARNEIPVLKEQLAEKELQLAEISQKSSVSKQLLTENWHRSICEVRRQYDAIDRALETLQSIQSVVMQCPPLAKMQQELEESNFQSISSLSVVQPDLNANAALVTSNGTHNNGKSCINSIHGTL